jgi:hypothetical protein
MSNVARWCGLSPVRACPGTLVPTTELLDETLMGAGYQGGLHNATNMV